MSTKIEEEFHGQAPFTAGLKIFPISEDSPLTANNTMIYAMGKISDVTLIGKTVEGEEEEYYMASSLPTAQITLDRLKTFVKRIEEYLEQ